MSAVLSRRKRAATTKADRCFSRTGALSIVASGYAGGPFLMSPTESAGNVEDEPKLCGKPD